MLMKHNEGVYPFFFQEMFEKHTWFAYPSKTLNYREQNSIFIVTVVFT